MAAELPIVITKDGEQGTLHPDESVAEGHVVVRLGETRFIVPTTSLEPQKDGSFLLALEGTNLPNPNVIPIVEERLDVSKRKYESSVTLKKVVTEHDETVQVPLASSQVEVNRVEIGRPVDGPIAIRTEGDTTIIPVLVEQVVVNKQLILEAEIHVTKKHVTEMYEKTLTLKSEEVGVQRSEEGKGHDVDER